MSDPEAVHAAAGALVKAYGETGAIKELQSRFHDTIARRDSNERARVLEAIAVIRRGEVR